MSNRLKVLIGCLIGSVLILVAALLIQPKDPACVKLEAKRSLALEFCKGLGMRAAQGRCSQLADDQETMGACMGIVLPVAESSCWGYLNLEAMKRELKDLCS